MDNFDSVVKLPSILNVKVEEEKKEEKKIVKTNPSTKVYVIKDTPISSGNSWNSLLKKEEIKIEENFEEKKKEKSKKSKKSKKKQELSGEELLGNFNF